MSIYKTHAVITVNSRDRDQGSIENFRVELKKSIILRSDVRYFVRPENIKLPIAFHQINSNFNTFTWSETDGVTPLQLDISMVSGSYTITELVAQLEIDMEAESLANGYNNAYDITWDDRENTVNISFPTTSAAGTSMTITANNGGGVVNSLNVSLGYLADGTETIAITSNLDAPKGASVQRIRYINIHTKSLPITNFYNKIGKQNIIAQVPITKTRWEFEFYKNDQGYMVQINSDNINEIFSTLRDEENNIIDMRGEHYSYNLVIYREKSMANKMINFFKKKKN